MSTPEISPIILIFASIFTSNIILANFLGLCSFISISKDIKSSNGLGMAVVFVSTISSAINHVIYHQVILRYELGYLRFIIFIIVIASVVQILEMIIDRISQSLYIALGIFLPLITVSFAILGVVLFMQIRNYSFPQALVYGFGSGVGWWIAIMALAAIRKKVENAPVPAGLKGPGITLIIIGIMAMAFIGFSGMLQVQ
ncbi:MAG: NADH:ubiquinone reductase (Na(+)-transporting) subunit E [Spirochaetes bacterium]|nr:NADH:ubiquinone reductase (Na(+)-transporting) subunit E [Spirochaetota bacterium]